ncbi:proton-conducting transporter membrane subunit [Curtobacterium sp. MCJR17_043]|uniref:proton-conducting transporter transmembrane domain-containing protein n=1 Tax=Curtobacterium sp. MCJR17_043 TaxID=2175660 RepID=UPI0024E00CCD|nr:proton-conducting transporter membrane subunit [Curtobacterium sp. MCJR17_043]WIB36224.1 proton-conducting transporter membrane subunit [Curtobacterium sp. MCJR17_043]
MSVSVVLVLVGALTKSAIVPFHFWLPAAMAAPTPVSAYLHAAAMVKAGIYLVARLAPAFALLDGWRETVTVLGVLGMLVGGYRALRQTDLKLLLAYGTVAQLGFLLLAAGWGAPEIALGGIVLLVAHATFKSTLFLVVGTVDHVAGTRDLGKLSGLGRRLPLAGRGRRARARVDVRDPAARRLRREGGRAHRLRRGAARHGRGVGLDRARGHHRRLGPDRGVLLPVLLGHLRPQGRGPADRAARPARDGGSSRRCSASPDSCSASRPRSSRTASSPPPRPRGTAPARSRTWPSGTGSSPRSASPR